MIDHFDPNNWPLSPPHEFRIYGDDNAQTYAVVDEEDYHFLVQWKWSWKASKTTPGKAPKKYLRRNVEIQLGDGYRGIYECPETGKTLRNRGVRIQQTLFLHTVVMLRTGIAPPSAKHHIPDHRNGKEWDCRRENLRWSTPSQNNRNLSGQLANHDFEAEETMSML